MSHVIRINDNQIQITDLLKTFMQFEEVDKITPSRYMKEIGMSVEERLGILNDRSRIQRIGRQNKLYIIPDIVVFQNFETHVKYSTSISFMHQKQHPVRIKVFFDLSPCFRLNELPKTVYSKLAPGTPHKMTLDFYSEEYRDYSSSVRFEAEDDVVYLPIVALAPRPILIFPDVIELPETVVNISSDKKVFMRNMGKSPVVFKLNADAPFSICPTTGIMEPNEVLDVKVSYKSYKVEKNTSDLVISFEGVELYATLICSVRNCEVYLDKTILYFEDTFLTLQRCISMKLYNKSEYTMKYQWKMFQTKYKDARLHKDYRMKLEDMYEYEVLRNIQKENPNITDAELHKTFLRRIYEDELAEFDSTDQFLYHNPNFRFMETSGVIGPYSVVNIEVVFCPTEATQYESIAYLDVTGRETRQPLKMVGTGLGPEVCFNFKVLDVENLYLCAKHQYEIVAKNEGHIPATLNYCHKNMDFGGLMSCSPDEVHIMPGKCEKMVLEFSSTMQGKFLENLNFRIAESGEYVSCVFQGNVVCPLLSYNIEEIDFGIVAFGFAVEKEISIQNTTEVPIEFRICILKDGSFEAITWVNFSRTHDETSVSKMPKEFSICPDEATVAGNSSIKIKITLVPNKPSRLSTYLRTYMWGSKKHYVELPIYYDCIVPTVECSPPRLDIRYCFINCPYDRMFTLRNISEVPGYILYNETVEDAGLSCKLSLIESYIEPGEEITIHLEIKGLQLGLHTKHLNFTVFGNPPSNLCKLTCDVQGPVICVNPEEIKFGHVPLLKWHSRKLHVMNDSPVPAYISIHVANPTFHVNPNEFKLEASEKLEVDISIYLTYIAKYTSILILNIVNSLDPLKVPISAFGIGSCILFEPILEPKYDLGTLMTHNSFKIPFKMTNMGRDLQKLYFSRVKDMKSMKEDTPTMRGHPFMIEPNECNLQEKEQKIGYIDVYHTVPGPIDLMYYCYSLDKSSKFTKVFEVKFVAQFEDPVLVLSKSSLNFRMDVTVDETISHLQETFTVTNESYLALDIYVNITPPFYVMVEEGERITALNVNVASRSEFFFIVEFVPPIGVKKCLISSGTMKIGFKLHPKIFLIPLTGDVNYPTLFTYPEAIKNHNIAPMADCSREVIIKNISPLPVAYQYEWEVESYTLEKLETPRNNMSSLENSNWNMKKIEDPNVDPTKEEETKQIIEHLVRENDLGDYKLPRYSDICNVLLENVGFPFISSDVKRKMLYLCKYYLYPIAQNVLDAEEDYLKILADTPETKPDINDAMLNITPYQGCLQPYECCLVNFYIRPPLRTYLKASAKCRILGGSEEKIDISAICGDIAYNVDKMSISFGYQLFCESLEEQITLSNTGHIGFEYIVQDDSNHPKTKNDIDVTTGLLTVSPNMGALGPGESVPLQIKYFPGITGDFNESFVLEIGYLSPISIKVSGTAVYSQLYIMLSRPSLFEAAEAYICYTAIGYLSKDLSNLHYNMKHSTEDSKLDSITTFILEQEDWSIVEIDDTNIPSTVDIDMAIERMIGYEFLQNNPQLLGERVSIRKKHFTIPNYMVPEYELDFGNVRRDGQYEQNVSLYNYGPGMILLRLFIADKKSIEGRGFFVTLDCQKIKLREFCTLNVKFRPDVKGADFSQPHISEVLYIEVNQGARIPIRISASVGVPTAELNVHCMDFCGVIVGSCKRKILCLYNVGFVDAKWSCTIDTTIFFVRKKEGVLAAGESEQLQVFFEPKNRGPKQGIMTFHVEGNNEDMTAYLNGYGREPNFVIKESLVQFPPVLQYSPALEESFFIQNAASFSTEIFLSDYDKQIELHERICNVFWREKNAKKVYIARSLYNNTPSDVYRFLYKELLLDRLRKEKSFTEVMKVSRTDIRGSSASIERLLDNLELRVDSSIARKKPAQDIFLDPSIEDDKPAVKRTTKIIVFHGNKYTDFVRAATNTSRILNIPRYNLDAMIIDILVENKTAFTQEVNKILEDAFMLRMDAEDCCCRESFIEDDTESIWRKVNAILSLDPVVKSPQSKKKGKDKADKGEKMSGSSSKQSRKTINTNTADTLLGIPEEMIIQILSDKIDQIDKMILESLDSVFLPNVQIALRCLLKAAKDLSCVYFVLFTCTLEEHTALETEEEETNATNEANRRQALHKKLTDLDDYSSITDEERAILMEILEEKKRRSDEKREELRGRIQEDLTTHGHLIKSNDLRSFWKYLDHSLSRNQVSSRTIAKSLKAAESHSTLIAKESKELKDHIKEKVPTKMQKKVIESDEDEDLEFYFYQFDIMLSEIMFLLEHWNRKNLEMEKIFPNFASFMASNRKDAKYNTKDFAKKVSKTRKSTAAANEDVIPDNIDENENVVITSFDPDIGYPVWLINQAHRKRSINLIEPIMALLKQMITMNCLTAVRDVCKDSEVVYTVLTKPTHRKTKEKLEVFDLIKCEAKGEELKLEPEPPVTAQMNDDDIQQNSNTTIGSNSRKKARRRKLTLTPTPSDMDQLNSISVRFLLEPGFIQEITALFKPLYCGFFKTSYSFEVVGTGFKEKIIVQASCDYPRIDTSPYTLFPHNVQSIDSKTMYLNGVYVMSQQTLDFGTVLLVPEHLLEMKSSISMLNTSGMLCSISNVFKSDDNVFFIDDEQKKVEIKPGRQHVLPIYAKPPAEGLFRETLLIIIRDNPRVEEINLSCFACPLKFEVTPKFVNFNKVILGKTESEKLHLKNNTAVMIYFEFEKDVTTEFKISTFNGYLDPCSSLEVTVTFVPENIGDKKESLILRIFDKEKQYPEPIQTEVLTLSAEVATFPLEYATSINLGLVKGKVPHYFPFTINNLGKYDVKIILTKPNHHGNNHSFGDFFKMKHMEYVVNGDSKYSNNCRFTCNKELSFIDIPVVHVMILDNYRNSAIDHFTFKATAKVALSKFELCPHGEYFFGYQNINTTRSSLLSLKNVGFFEFRYTIMTLDMIEEQALKKLSKKEVVQTEETEKLSSIPSVVSESQEEKVTRSKSLIENKKKGKIKAKSRSALELITKISTGTFDITPSTGTVQPNESVSISIESQPTECKKYKDTIVFFVSEPSYEDRKGRNLNLHVEGTEPQIDFSDYETMFPLQYVVKNIEDLPCIGENIVFETSKKILHFGKVALNDSISTKFRVPNTGHVTATVSYEIQEKDCGFTIQSKIIDIAPYKSEFNVIEFAPKAIGIWTGTLEIQCQGFSTEYNYSMTLIGEACMPSIEIVEPDYSIDGENTEISFGPIAIKSSCEKLVVLRNRSYVPSKIIVEIIGDPDWFMSLSLHNEQEETYVEKREKKHSDVMMLKSGEKGYVNIKFEAKSATFLNCQLQIIVINNCFDMWKLGLNAFSFDATVSIEGLPVHVIPNQKRITYSLNYGPVGKNELHRIHFKVKNVTDDIYRFEFNPFQELIISPRIGHLYGESEKTIIAAFTTKRHIDMNQREIFLTITKIKLHPGHIFPLPWDDRQNANIAKFKFQTTEESDEDGADLSLDKVVYENNEPPYDIAKECSSISLTVNAQCGYAEYVCETKEIIFPPTNIHTALSKTFSVENKSKVNLEIDWNITRRQDENIPSARQPSLFAKMQLSEPDTPQFVCNVLEVIEFSIEPKVCTILPEKHQEFEIIYMPIDHKPHEYLLRANMKNLDPKAKDLEIHLKGEIQDFPYILSSNFMQDFTMSENSFKTYCGLGSGDATKILNFLSLGIGSECNRSILISNNTQNPFSFVWHKIRVESQKSSFFHCEFNKGQIRPGKVAKTNFLFIPQSHGAFTDCFQFEPEEPLMPRSSLLLQGVCREPRVFFEHAYLTLGVTLLNNLVEKEIVLKNDEEVKIHYSFKKSSLFSDNQQVLNISPMNGLMEPKSDNKLRVSIKPSKEGETIFKPKCIVQYMSGPIHFNFLMNIVDVSSKLIFYGRESSAIEVYPNTPLKIDLGLIVPHKRIHIKFELVNTSNVGFYYSWISQQQLQQARIKFSRKEGYLCSSQKIVFVVSLLALRKCLMKYITLKLKILYGSTYVLKIEASTQKQQFTFSFLKYDFGKCLIQKEQTKFYQTTLVFTNNNKWTMIVEYGHNNISPFFIDFKSAEVKGEESKKIDIYFSPTKHSIYETVAIFFVDSFKVIIRLCGEGVPLLLEVLSLTDKFLDFGKVRVGKCVQKSVKILNAGESNIDVLFAFNSQLPSTKKKIEKIEEEFSIEDAKAGTSLRLFNRENIQLDAISTKKKGKIAEKENKSVVSKEDKTSGSSREKIIKDKKEALSKDLIIKSIEKFHSESEMKMINSRERLEKFISGSIEVLPKKSIKIPPKKTADIIVKFKPTEPREKFQSQIFYQVQNRREPILTVMGLAIDARFVLNKDVINFGNVVVGYNSEESIILINEGFIGGKFRWYLEKNSSYISFIGGDGYCPPNSKVTTNIIFKPGHVQCVFKFKAYCRIENYKERLELILTGGSMNLPPPLDTLQFTAAIREESTLSIEFKNDSKESWKTEPVFTGSYFSGAHTLRVPKESTATYDIIYTPMKMKPSQHKGTVFFPFSNGMNSLYALEGTVLPPNPTGEIFREICCKTYHSEILNVENWLGLRQQFKIITEVLEGNSTRMIYKITSNEHFDVPPYGKRDFKWTIYVVNEGKLVFKVTFLNEKTREYLYYVIVLKIVPLETSIENIELSTCVREYVVKKIVVNNPLPESVEYTVTTSSPYLLVDSSFIVLPQEKYQLTVKYLPVKVEYAHAVLTISNPAVGTYTYNLTLKALAPNSEPEVQFQAQLGQSLLKSIQLPLVLQNADINTKIINDNSAFEVIRIQNQSDKPFIEVLFLPSEIGVNRTALQITSIVGEYTYPLVGECLRHEPQGPFLINLGESITIEIINPFEEDKNFTFSVDNIMIFQVKPCEEQIKGKKSTKITVSAASEKRLSKAGSSSSVAELGKVRLATAKLTVQCENELKWIYYLQCNSFNK